MKKKLLSAIASGTVFALFFPVMTFASTNPAVTFVSGSVTHNGNPVSGANVTVTCNSNVLNDTSKASGGYAVKYNPASLCPNGDLATVSATLGSLHGTNSGTVNKLTSKLNVDVVNVSVVPELGAAAAAGAIIIGGGTFMVIRQRRLHANA